MWLALGVAGWTLAIAAAAGLLGVFLSRSTSRSSGPGTSTPTATPSSPTTPTTTETPTTEMFRAMADMAAAQARETRELVVTILQGREMPASTGETSPTTPTPLALTDYDDDSIPLSAGIAEQISREAAERQEQDRLRRERQALMQEWAKVTERMRANGIDPQGPVSVADDSATP